MSVVSSSPPSAGPAGLARRSSDLFKPAPLIDGCGRRIDHLRLSVTDACDLRCAYCRPTACGPTPRAAVLSDRQRAEFTAFLCRRYGLSRVRFTGGEPLMHDSLASLIAQVRELCPGLALTMTTNGRRLAEYAADLRAAGLQRLNVSLDTLDPATYRNLTGGKLADVLAGIEAAQAAGFAMPKLNAVALRGVNDAELVELATWAMRRGSEMRFLEAMPIGPAAEFARLHFTPAREIRERLAAAFELEPLPRGPGETAARYHATGESGSGVIGIVAPVSEPFCASCRRIRLVANGRLYPCLLDERCVDMTVAWRDGVLDEPRAAGLIESAVAAKAPAGRMQPHAMVSIGG
jgi:cyclic pyranopterin phosphate synthase